MKVLQVAEVVVQDVRVFEVRYRLLVQAVRLSKLLAELRVRVRKANTPICHTPGMLHKGCSKLQGSDECF